MDEKRDDKRADLRAVLREIAAESGDVGPHVGSKRLIAYRQGTLPAAEREDVQEHLSLCARCTALLRELRDFEAAAAADAEGTAAAGPESLKEEAWDALVQHLPPKAPAIRPVIPPPQMRRTPYFLYAAAAALLLAVAGLSLWSMVTVQQERQRVASLERRLEERDLALATVQRSLAETGRQLDAARARIQGLETSGTSRSTQREDELAARVAELTSDLKALRRQQPPPDRIAAISPDIDLSVSPRFVLRGEPSDSAFLRGGGAVNPVRIPSAGDRFTVALDLADASDSPQVRLELTDRGGKVLWSGRQPGNAFLGDDGTSVTLRGLGPGLYRLRIEGLQPDRTRLLAEYLLDVKLSKTP